MERFFYSLNPNPFGEDIKFSALDQIGWPKCVVSVDFHIPADLDVPIQPFLEYTASTPMHLGKVVNGDEFLRRRFLRCCTG